MEQRWIARRHEEIITKQRDEESAALMGEWEKRRVHLEEEAVRNQEASRFASVLERRAEHRPQPAPPKVVDVSQPRASKPPLAPKTNLELDALAKIRKLNSHLLHTSGEPAPERDLTPDPAPRSARKFKSLSPYAGVRADGDSSALAPEVTKFRQQTQEEVALQAMCSLWGAKHEDLGEKSAEPTFEEMRRNQLEEVDRIKRCFGYYNVPCSAAVLERALVMPAQKPTPEVGLPCNVPRLLINPFFDSDAGVKKKKKGKKKR
jgi:hypothetical protein